jgi:phosphatidylserine/phosphatidylglycerophosphate/cardiolipin synthase-like enzyme
MHNRMAADEAHKLKMSVRFVPQPNLLHAKSLVVDGLIVWAGSGNMTAAAAHHNHELYIHFEHEEIARRIEARWNMIANP